jgi:hypothetical protein
MRSISWRWEFYPKAQGLWLFDCQRERYWHRSFWLCILIYIEWPPKLTLPLDCLRLRDSGLSLYCQRGWPLPFSIILYTRYSSFSIVSPALSQAPVQWFFWWQNLSVTSKICSSRSSSIRICILRKLLGIALTGVFFQASWSDSLLRRFSTTCYI